MNKKKQIAVVCSANDDFRRYIIDKFKLEKEDYQPGDHPKFYRTSYHEYVVMDNGDVYIQVYHRDVLDVFVFYDFVEAPRAKENIDYHNIINKLKEEIGI